MKKNKFLLFALLPLTSFGIIGTFLLPSFKAYSQVNNSSKEEEEKFTCDKYYQKRLKEVYPRAEAYCDALVNTKIRTDKMEIWENLTAIVEHNEKLHWEKNKVNSRVLVITWTPSNRYTKDEEMNAHKDIWVTAVPDLHDFCHNYYDKNKDKNPKLKRLPYRLNQVLGLAPEASEKYEERKLVEIWVKPKDLVRPTPDPEITDREAELNFPQSDSLAFVSYEYKLWFLNQLMTNSHPWTKLGYTYDWGNKEDWNGVKRERPKIENVGLSEFIIRKGAPIKIHSINTAKHYCEKKHEFSS